MTTGMNHPWLYEGFDGKLPQLEPLSILSKCRDITPEVLIDGTWHQYCETQESVEGKHPVPSVQFPVRLIGSGNFPVRIQGREQAFSEDSTEFHYWAKVTED